MNLKMKDTRTSLGLSQAELAKRIGVTQGSIGNYESGVSNPKMELMQKLFDIEGVERNLTSRLLHHCIMKTESVEIFLDTAGTKQSYFQIVASKDGIHWDSRTKRNPEYWKNVKWRAENIIDEDGQYAFSATFFAISKSSLFSVVKKSFSN